MEEEKAILSVNIVRTGDVTLPARVVCTTIAGTAMLTDFVELQRVLRFEPGETSRTFNVYAKQDHTDEPDQMLTLQLSDPVGTELGTPSVTTVTIVDMDPPLVVGLVDPAIVVTEGPNAVATLRVGAKSQAWEFDGTSSGTDFPLTVDYTTFDQTATAGSDYTAMHGTVTLGDTIEIPILADATTEAPEPFGVRLSNCVNGSVDPYAAEAEVRIVDPAGGRPVLIAKDTSFQMSRFYAPPTYLTVELQPASSETVTASAVFDNGWTLPVVFPPGVTSVQVALEPGRSDTPPQYCSLAGRLIARRYELVNAVNADIARRYGVYGTIHVSAISPVLPPFDSRQVVEGNEGEVVSSFRMVPYAYCFDPSFYGFATEDGGARVGTDYKVEAAPSDMWNVKVLGDTRHEGDETFTFRMYGARNSAIEFTIVDDDPAAFADMEASVIAPRPAFAGGAATFRIILANRGPDNATSVVVRNELPGGAVYRSTIGSDAICTGDANLVTCRIETLPAGTSLSLDITAQLSPVPGLLTNVLTVSSDSSDPTPPWVSTAVEVLPATAMAIPTLTEWMLSLLVLCLGFASVAQLKNWS